MTNLTCSVSSCASNAAGLCRLPHIRVGGPHAHAAAGTRCASYTERGSQWTNQVGDAPPATAPTEVGCEACECGYNRQERCTAPEIRVSPCACGTECETFTEKGKNNQ